jgi:hypothetical protein
MRWYGVRVVMKNIETLFVRKTFFYGKKSFVELVTLFIFDWLHFLFLIGYTLFFDWFSS